MTDSGCILCEPAPHENCETYSVVTVSDPVSQKETNIEVCIDHFDTIQNQL
jgi:hypothetical protein